jgi:molecular chaperone GrpE
MTESTSEQNEAAGTAATNGAAAPETAAQPGSLEEQLASARAEADDMRDKYLRTRAEMDNFRKRMERNYADQSRSQTKALLSRLLGVKDNLERALQYGDGGQSGEGIIEGVRLTLYQLDNLLEQEGVKGIEAEGRAFDPHLDEAVHSVHDPEVADHTVIQVVRKGYTYGDEVLRPAQVVVSVHE